MRHEHLRQEVCAANQSIVALGLVCLTWGNVSGVDRKAGVLAIKPSGVGYASLTPEQIVVVALESGRTIEGELRPSSDTETHRHLYLNFPNIGGIVHTHSTHATSFAQANREIPCLGTTHADHFHGAIPVTRHFTDEEIATGYEWNTGCVIVERFVQGGIDPDHIPGALVAGHGPFAWGPNVKAAVENALVLEEVARMASITWQLAPETPPISRALLDKHYLRKHGSKAYYGQNLKGENGR